MRLGVGEVKNQHGFVQMKINLTRKVGGHGSRVS